MKILLLLITLHLALPLFAADEETSLYFPPAKGQWEKIDSAQIGWNPAKLKELMNYARNNKSSGVVILYRGRILAEQYWPLDPKEKTAEGKPNPYFHMRLGKNAKGRAIEDVASAQKSVTAMLVGIAQHKGLLKITDPVHKHLGKGWSKAPAAAEAKITIRHLITMSSGLNPRLQFVAPAGSKWFYNTGAYSKALTCVSKAAKSLCMWVHAMDIYSKVSTRSFTYNEYLGDTMVPLAEQANHKDEFVTYETVVKSLQLEGDKSSNYYRNHKFMNNYSALYS